MGGNAGYTDYIVFTITPLDNRHCGACDYLNFEVETIKGEDGVERQPLYSCTLFNKEQLNISFELTDDNEVTGTGSDFSTLYTYRHPECIKKSLANNLAKQ